MTRSPLDPSLSPPDESEDTLGLLAAFEEHLRPTAIELATALFVGEIAEVLYAPAEHLVGPWLATSEESEQALRASRLLLERRLRAQLSDSELAAITTHADELTQGLASGWINAWSHEAQRAEGRLRCDVSVPISQRESWMGLAEELGLSGAEADAVISTLYQTLLAEGTRVELPLGLVLDARTSAVWLYPRALEAAAPAEVAQSGAQPRAATTSVFDALRKRFSR
ncbi:MAG: hypothetical protein Q8Q09_23545 [Deltaproteobacteria bacterium]|nr:hypothetical protein [Deltaproteobacteria bacterium]